MHLLPPSGPRHLTTPPNLLHTTHPVWAQTEACIMPSPWNASTERKLLLCLIDPKATPRWQLIAQGMGPHFSAEACRYVLDLWLYWQRFSFTFVLISLLHFSSPPACSKFSPLIFHPSTLPTPIRTMPYQWTAERERRMLLLAISSANLRPSSDTWTTVAALLGDGLTPSAVRSAN